MRRIRPARWPRLLSVAIVGLVVLELLSQGISKLFFASEWARPVEAYNRYLSDVREAAWFYPVLPHPYFGIQLDKETRKDVNNYGFQSAVDYPYRKRPDEFVIGVLGGSVPQFMMKFAAAHDSFAPLAKKVPELNGKRIVALNLCLPAGKQPQQFLIATYFARMVDLFINIDGLFETFVEDTRYPAALPVAYHYVFGPGKLGPIDQMLIVKSRSLARSISREALQTHLLGHSGLHFLLWKFTVALHERVKAWVMQSARARNGKGRPYLEARNSDVETWGELLENWTRFTTLQDFVTRKEGRRTAFFLRPTQYYEGFEPGLALRVGERPSVPARYAALLSRARDLRKKGILTFDLSDLFTGTDKEVYKDDADHLTDLGHEMLIRRIIDLLAENPKTLFARAPDPAQPAGADRQ